MIIELWKYLMFKKLMLLSVVLSLGACETINQASQCDPEKNYIISNPQAIDEYKKLYSENKIRSVYYKITPTRMCNWDSCVNFNTEKFDFVEKYFDDKYRKGIYKIYSTKDMSRKDCFEKDPTFTSIKNICFYAVKNLNNEVDSNYTKEIEEKNGVNKISLYNNKTKEYLFKFSYQAYSKHAIIGESSAGICKENRNNNQKYNFDIGLGDK